MELSQRILMYLDQNESADTLQLVKILGEDHQKVVGAVKSIEALGELINSQPITNKEWTLTAEGNSVAERGSHEALFYNSVDERGSSQAELMKNVPNAKVGFSKAMSAGWITIDKSGGTPIVRKKAQQITDTVQEHLLLLQKGVNNIADNILNEYKKRKLLQDVTTKSYFLQKGTNFTITIEKPETNLTSEMLSSGLWKTLTFKPYNFHALGAPCERGHLHPLLKVRTEFRQIFLEMGFIEMPTNNYVESSFWNFDTLFQPQQHPARDAHDTFFIADPAISNNFPMDYLERVKKVHGKGGYGSQGYGYDWKIEEAQKNLLRTHTTAVSARMLYALAEEKEFTPKKYFSIDRVFRNETLDATHLAEFHQVEGVIADRALGLADLIAVLDTFFKRLGFNKLQFKPAYNPYTEPSMEIFCYHEDWGGKEMSQPIQTYEILHFGYQREPRTMDCVIWEALASYMSASTMGNWGLGKWIEIGNSGVFRPEMLLPMGLPADVNVIAWGLSLERPTMVKYGLNNIRDLVGPKVDLQMVKNNALCRMD